MTITIISIIVVVLFVCLLYYAYQRNNAPASPFQVPNDVEEVELPARDTLQLDPPTPEPIIAPAPAPENDEAMTILDYRNLLARHPSKRYGMRPLNRVDKLMLHHSATLSGSAEAYAAYHVKTLGWPGIGYHFVIEKDGTIKQTNSLDVISYQVSGQNTSSIGICCTGNYDEQTPPVAQMNALVWLLKRLKGEFPYAAIAGHRDYSTKSCPGAFFPFDRIVQQVEAPLATNTPSAPEAGPSSSLGFGLIALATVAYFLR